MPHDSSHRRSSIEQDCIRRTMPLRLFGLFIETRVIRGESTHNEKKVSQREAERESLRDDD
jgi:hypothetical protein